MADTFEMHRPEQADSSAPVVGSEVVVEDTDFQEAVDTSGADIIQFPIQEVPDSDESDVFVIDEGILRRTRSTAEPRTVKERFNDIDPDEPLLVTARKWTGIIAAAGAGVIDRTIDGTRAVRSVFSAREPVGGWKTHGKTPPKPMVKDRVPSYVAPKAVAGTDQSDPRLSTNVPRDASKVFRA